MKRHANIQNFHVKLVSFFTYGFYIHHDVIQVLCQQKDLNEMSFFFQISSLKILAIVTTMPVFFALIFKKPKIRNQIFFL